jgi:hypothetical protein
MLPDAFDANGDGSGINAAARLAGFDATCEAAGPGNLSSRSTECSGNRHADIPQPDLIPIATRRSVVFASCSHQRN